MLKIMFLLVTSLFIGLHMNAQDISWSPDHTLKWSDFKGVPDVRSSWFAASRYRLKYAYEARHNSSANTYTLSFRVQGVFIPELSWVKKGKQSAALLAHEQLHFDINELYSRRLLQQFKNYPYTADYKNEVSKIFQSVSQEEYDLQTRYDRETQHSVNKERQTMWNRLIRKQLSSEIQSQ